MLYGYETERFLTYPGYDMIRSRKEEDERLVLFPEEFKLLRKNKEKW